MSNYWKSCENCGATIAIDSTSCDRCNASTNSPENGQPRFSKEAREAGESLGGLLMLHPVNGEKVRYIGWCPGGGFGVDIDGKIIWIEDWGYMSDLTIEQGKLRFAGKLADIDTGKII